MKPHFKYLKYVLKHKWFVFLVGRRLGVAYWQLIIHDWTKFTRAEWTPYVNNFYNNDGSPKIKAAFEEAVSHHYKYNKHHSQHWSSHNQIPEKYLREMVADWCGAGKAKNGHWDIVEWYNKNRKKMKLHVEDEIMVERLIPGFMEKSYALFYQRMGEVNDSYIS